MNKVNKLIIFLIALFAFVAFSACASKYDAMDCETPISYPSEENNYDFHPTSCNFDFNKVIEENGVKYYYESGLKGATIDHTVDTVKRLQEYCEVPERVFIFNDGYTYSNGDGLWINPDDGKELIGAVIMNAASSSDLPFGVFAGASADIFEKEVSFSEYNEKRLDDFIQKYPHVTEFQYPLYSTTITTKEERNTAWSYAHKVVKDYLSNHTINELISSSLADWTEIFGKYAVKLSEYKFYIGDIYFPIKAETEYFRYYFPAKFNDKFLGNDFPLQYSNLSEFIKENDFIIKSNIENYGFIGRSDKIKVYLGNFGIYSGVSTIDFDIYSETSMFVMQQAMYSIAALNGLYGKLQTYFCHYISFSSTTYKRFYFNYYIGKTKIENEEYARLYSLANKLYDDTYGKSDMEKFDAINYCECLSLIYWENYEKIFETEQFIIFIKYLCDNYGFEFYRDFSPDYSVKDGPELETLTEEWISNLSQKYSR